MNDFTEIRCPKCGGIIERDDVYDKSSYDDMYIDYCCGHCSSCNTEYEWQEVYQFTHQENLTEVS